MLFLFCREELCVLSMNDYCYRIPDSDTLYTAVLINENLLRIAASKDLDIVANH